MQIIWKRIDEEAKKEKEKNFTHRPTMTNNGNDNTIQI